MSSNHKKLSINDGNHTNYSSIRDHDQNQNYPRNSNSNNNTNYSVRSQSSRSSSKSIEFRHTDSARSFTSMLQHQQSSERISLLRSSSSIRVNDSPRDGSDNFNDHVKKIRLCAAFLMDYEAGRSPIFAGCYDDREDHCNDQIKNYSHVDLKNRLPNDSNFNIDPSKNSSCSQRSSISKYHVSHWMLGLYTIRYHPFWEIIRFISIICFFAASEYDAMSRDQLYETPSQENFSKDEVDYGHLKLISFACLIMILDRFAVYCLSQRQTTIRDVLHIFSSAADNTNNLKMLLTLLFSFIFIFEAWLRIVGVSQSQLLSLLIGATKPVFLFMMYSQARDGIQAVIQATPVTSKVIIMELIFISIFAAIATSLYSEFEAFHHFEISFLSMFECKYSYNNTIIIFHYTSHYNSFFVVSTTVVNPSKWMPVYNSDRSSAIFFIIFGVVCIFYMHSLVLSTVFNSYITAMHEVIDRINLNKEQCLLYAFRCLEEKPNSKSFVWTDDVREVFKLLRPHYTDKKVIYLHFVIKF